MMSETGFLSVRVSLLVLTMAVQFSKATLPVLTGEKGSSVSYVTT